MSSSFTRFGSLPCFGGFDFAGVFAQFRLDVFELELRVDVFFGFAGDYFAALQRWSERIR